MAKANKKRFTKKKKKRKTHGTRATSCYCLNRTWNTWIPVLTTDETWIAKDFIFLLLLTPQISESVDDDTKDEVEDDNDDNEEEEEVVYHTGYEQRLLQQWPTYISTK